MTEYPVAPPARRRIEQRGLWFEELEPDVVYVHRPGRTVSEYDNVLFTTLTMNTQALHLDDAWSAEQAPFNQRLVNSMFTLSTLVGLSVAQLTQGTIVGNLGFGAVAFPRPVFHGDTLYAETTVVDKRVSVSRPEAGIVTLAHTARNQHGDVVATATSTGDGPASSARRTRGWVGVTTPPGPTLTPPPGVAWLFCPADRPERFAKAAAVADVVILDLEDGVSPADRPAAREFLRATPLDPERTVVRINPAGTDDHASDLRALAGTSYRTVMLAKAESADQVAALVARPVVALCETPLGVLNAAALAVQSNVVALMWGAEDLVAALGGSASRTESGGYRDVARHARSSVLLAAGAYGRLALDAVYLDIEDRDGLADETAEAVASGFGAKACIHPAQVEVVRAGYRPGQEQLDWARRVLAAATSERGVFRFEGKMVDEPVLRQARRIVAW